MKAPKDLYMLNEKDELFIRLKYSGIPMLVIISDGFTLYYKGKKTKTKTPYLKVQDVIDCHKKEFKATQGKAGDLKLVENLENRLLDVKKVEV